MLEPRLKSDRLIPDFPLHNLILNTLPRKKPCRVWALIPQTKTCPSEAGPLCAEISPRSCQPQCPFSCERLLVVPFCLPAFSKYFRQQLLVLCLTFLSELLQREPSPYLTVVLVDVCTSRHTAKSAQPSGVVPAAAITLCSGVTHSHVPKEPHVSIFGWAMHFGSIQHFSWQAGTTHFHD